MIRSSRGKEESPSLTLLYSSSISMKQRFEIKNRDFWFYLSFLLPHFLESSRWLAPSMVGGNSSSSSSTIGRILAPFVADFDCEGGARTSLSEVLEGLAMLFSGLHSLLGFGFGSLGFGFHFLERRLGSSTLILELPLRQTLPRLPRPRRQCHLRTARVELQDVSTSKA